MRTDSQCVIVCLLWEEHLASTQSHASCLCACTARNAAALACCSLLFLALLAACAGVHDAGCQHPQHLQVISRHTCEAQQLWETAQSMKVMKDLESAVKRKGEKRLG